MTTLGPGPADEALGTRVHAGDEAAFKELLDRHAPVFRARILQRMGRSTAACEKLYGRALSKLADLVHGGADG